MPKASIVIPVFNKWNLTRKCLKAIAANTPADLYEVIVVDNASSDETPRGVPYLGKALFGDNFQYIRNEINRNFSGASNQGAEAAKGEYIVFLNNDTETQAGWLEKLLQDFADYPNIAATGPLLLYPEETPLGKLVQHLGVMITPFMSLGHLHQWIPAKSPLAQKRRFFQVITAACMVIPRKLFLEAGKFDEDFINGFEDVDLCARLTALGYVMTVNPKSIVIHHESQSPGRHAHETSNSRALKNKSLHLLKPDWHAHLHNDGLKLVNSKWQRLYAETPSTPPQDLGILPADELIESIAQNPYSQPLWEELIARAQSVKERKFLCETYLKFFPNPENRLKLVNMPWVGNDLSFKSSIAGMARTFLTAPEYYLSDAHLGFKICSSRLLPEMAIQFAEQIKGYEEFKKNDFPKLAEDLWKLERSIGHIHYPLDMQAYNTWIHAVDAKRRKKEIDRFMLDFNSKPEDFPKISILMPVYNPNHEHLRSALDSVLAQVYPSWELCVADDASTDSGVAKILKEYAEKDPRIKVVFREENGHIAKATNSALALAAAPWTGLMDQDDLLTPDALAYTAKTIKENPDALMVFSDEDKTHDGYVFFDPHFKNNRWDPELIPAQNYVCHFAVFKTERMGEGFRDEFPGAQDHDFTLRYTEDMDPARIIHIPHVLYHWRAHEGSTAQSISAKAYASDSGEKAGSAYLARQFPGAALKENGKCDWPRTCFPLPARIPPISLILAPSRPSFPLIEYFNAWSKKTRLPFEMVVVVDKSLRKNLSKLELPENIKIAASPDHLSYSDRLLLGAKASSGSVIGIISPDAVPVSNDWLEEIISCISRKSVGAVGGKLVHNDGSLADAGYLADAGGGIKAVFAGRKPEEDYWYGWPNLARTVDALNGKCLFTYKDTLLKTGLSNSMGDWSLEDYCLRLASDGLKIIWWPYAEFLLLASEPKTDGAEVFSSTWSGKIKPVNENLLSLGALWELADPEDDKFDFSAPEYLKLYPDLASLPIDPLGHYLRCGLMEGRRGRISHVNYSSLTSERKAAWRKSGKNGVTVCTSLCGDYEELLPPAFINDGWKYVCYSDRPRETWGVWEIRPIPFENADNTRRSRWAKMNLPLLFPDEKWVFWQDANIIIKDDISGLLSGRDDSGLWMVRHPVRQCVYQEAQACLDSKKESKEKLDAQAAAFAQNGMPRNFGMWENNFFLINPENRKIADIFAQWWTEYMKYSKRDQLSLPYVFYKNSFLPGVLLPDGKNARTWPGLYFLTHEETRWITPPQSILV